MSARAWNYGDADTRFVGELHDPAGPPNGHAILVVHEADGIGGNVRRRCGMLAELGYVAAAADIHGEGRVLTGDAVPAALDWFREDPARLRSRMRTALHALSKETGLPTSNIAAIGYCFGGWAVLELARDGADLAAVASFHGLLTTAQPATPRGIRSRIFASTGALDPLVPPEDLAMFQAEMSAAKADWQLFIHGQALHSFTNVDVDGLGDPRMAYDGPADRQSWSALLAFLREIWPDTATTTPE